MHRSRVCRASQGRRSGADLAEPRDQGKIADQPQKEGCRRTEVSACFREELLHSSSPKVYSIMGRLRTMSLEILEIMRFPISPLDSANLGILLMQVWGDWVGW